MDEDLKARIIAWVNKNLKGYIIKSPSDYRTPLVQDAITKFGSCSDTDEAKEVGDRIAEVIRKRLNCEY
jgi:hypothetical protein